MLCTGFITSLLGADLSNHLVLSSGDTWNDMLLKNCDI